MTGIINLLGSCLLFLLQAPTEPVLRQEFPTQFVSSPCADSNSSDLRHSKTLSSPLEPVAQASYVHSRARVLGCLTLKGLSVWLPDLKRNECLASGIDL